MFGNYKSFEIELSEIQQEELVQGTTKHIY